MADPDRNPNRINNHRQDLVPEEDAADRFIRIFKDQLRPDLAIRIADDLFQPGRELELAQSIERITDEHLVRDKIPIGRQLRKKLIESILDDIAHASKERFGGK